jgi:Arc/MetJ-type ribon-helix-helix transcriptional regulator
MVADHVDHDAGARWFLERQPMVATCPIADDECEDLDRCVDEGQYPSRSAVLLRALRLLRCADLGAMYAEAFTEWASSDEGADWDGVDTASEVS